MEMLEVMRDRFSCKKFNGEKVNRQQLDLILEAGRLTPTAKNLQEQKVYVLESEAALAKFDRHCPCRYGAGTVLIVGFDTNNVFTYPGEKRNSGIEDASIVATHMMLMAASLNVDSCWLNYFNPDELAKELNLPENVEILMALDLGYGDAGSGALANHYKRKEVVEFVEYL